MYIIDCYFSRMVTLNTQQHLKDWLLIVFCYFTFFDLIVFFLVFSFQTLMYKETSRLLSILHIVYFESFCYVMYYIAFEICIGEHFLEDCFYCYSQQMKSSVAHEPLIPYNLIKRTPYFFLGRELLFIDLKPGTHTKQLKNVQSNKNFLNMTWHFLLKSSYNNILNR